MKLVRSSEGATAAGPILFGGAFLAPLIAFVVLVGLFVVGSMPLARMISWQLQ